MTPETLRKSKIDLPSLKRVQYYLQRVQHVYNGKLNLALKMF